MSRKNNTNKSATPYYIKNSNNNNDGGNIKQEWKKTALGELVTFQRGHDLPKNQRIMGEFPLVSSSGIVEAASFNVPVINIGTRQDGKFKRKNVIDCKYSWRDIYSNILRING